MIALLTTHKKFLRKQICQIGARYVDFKIISRWSEKKNRFVFDEICCNYVAIIFPLVCLNTISVRDSDVGPHAGRHGRKYFTRIDFSPTYG